jgi:AcrR family transcriptional regulator
MTQTKVGRPRRGESSVGREEILKAALELLQSAGPQGLSMRALARSMKINPMTLYYHVGDRAALLRALADQVYSGVVERAQRVEGVREKIERLLGAYHEAVMRHPNLATSLFSTPAAFSIEALRITKFLSSLLGEADLSPAKAKLWLAILVDYTHGSGIAFAMNATLKRKSATNKVHSQEFALGMAELLDAIFVPRTAR